MPKATPVLVYYLLLFEFVCSFVIRLQSLVDAPSLDALLPVQSTVLTIVVVLWLVKNGLIRHRWARLQAIQSLPLPVN